MIPVIDLASGYLQSLITGGVKGSSPANHAVRNIQDTNQLSPFAQILSGLQQVEQSNPPQYQEVTQRIAGDLQSASRSATSAGDTALGSQLTKLSTDFRNASTSGQLPNVQDMAQAIGGGSLLHHPKAGGFLRSSVTSGSGSNASYNTAGNLSKFLESPDASQTGGSADSSLNALSIIDNTLSSAGIQIG